MDRIARCPLPLRGSFDCNTISDSEYFNTISIKFIEDIASSLLLFFFSFGIKYSSSMSFSSLVTPSFWIYYSCFCFWLPLPKITDCIDFPPICRKFWPIFSYFFSSCPICPIFCLGSPSPFLLKVFRLTNSFFYSLLSDFPMTLSTLAYFFNV